MFETTVRYIIAVPLIILYWVVRELIVMDVEAISHDDDGDDHDDERRSVVWSFLS